MAGQRLLAHPDAGHWLQRAGVDSSLDPHRAAFIEASTWADDIRSDPRFYSVGIDEPTPTQDGYPDMERRRDWHYINRPLVSPRPGQSPAPASGQIDHQLPRLFAQLADPKTPLDAQTYALPWLIHLTGDAHQPLHVAAKPDANGKWDKLGNSVLLDNPFDTRKPPITLHAFWDSLPGPPWLRGQRLDSASRALTALHPSPPAASAISLWLDESWQLARNSGYPPDSDPPGKISEAFLDQSRAIAYRRVAEAGYRLAGLLNEIFSERKAADQ